MIIAESVLTAVDLALVDRHPSLRATRRLDDYEMVASTREEAEEYLASAQEVLSDFELLPNHEKTRIVQLPDALHDTWARRLRQYATRMGGKGQATALVDFFDEIFAAARSEPQSHVVQFALGLLAHLDVERENWQLFQHLLAQAVVCEPGAIRQVSALFSDGLDRGLSLNRQLVSDMVNQTVTQQAPHGHSSELAWALRLALQTKSRLDEDATDALAKSDDDVVACLALHANKRKLLTDFVPPSTWLKVLSQEGLYGPHWLLAYEANVKNWLPVKTDYVSRDPAFGFLKQQNVGFFGVDVQRISKAVPVGCDHKVGSQKRQELQAAMATSARVAAAFVDEYWF